MNGDIKLTAPGGRPGDIWLDVDSTALSDFTITGKVVSLDGTPRADVDITVFERRSLTVDARIGTATTDARGGYSVSFTLPQATLPDAFVRAEDTAESESVDSVLLSDIAAGTHTVDLVLGNGEYEGRSEWDRIEAKLERPLGGMAPKDVPAAKLEWLSKQADVFPLHLAAYVQAHRIADGRSVKPESCYAFLRAGLPPDLRGLLGAGEPAWSGALRSAWARGLLPLPGDGSAEDRDQEVIDEVAAMREIMVDAAVTVPTSGVNQRVVFDTAGLTEEQQRVFHELWMENDGTLDDFWTAVAGSTLPVGAPLSAEVDLLKFTVQAATLVGTHIETLEALQAEREVPSITTVSELAEWSVSEWDAMLDARSVTPPDDIPGEGAAKRQNYARVLFNIWEGAYPSPSVQASIERDELAMTPPPNSEFVAIFLGNNPEFDIVNGTLGNYLAGAVSPWTGIDPGDQAEARANLEAFQRVYRLTPPIGRYATARVLLEAGVISATQIVANTRTEFVATFTPLLASADHDDASLAGAIWDNGAKVNATVVTLVSQLALGKTNADFVPVVMPGAAQFLEAENGLAELATILGSLDYCACEHCRSVFSPAAYFADLLAFLKKRPAETADHALEVLLARRPDLEHIKLDCANTNTVMPYIDLTNELIEDYINGGLGTTSKQTTWKAAELRLHPEHLDATVYDGATMTTTVHPWTLPFSLATVEAQTYLRHLGIPRHELMRRFAVAAPGDAFLDALAGDVLGLNAVEFSIVAGLYEGNVSADDREYWGFEDGAPDDDWVGILIGTDAEEGDVGELLIRGRMELAELRELLTLDYINPDGSIVIDWDESCELADAIIEFADTPAALAALHRIHRFVRLQRACKIPARMLNVLLRDALGGTLNQASLRILADIVRLKDRLRLKWDELATFWANVIDARDYEDEPRALYTRRFLGKDFGPVDPDFVPAGDGTELFGSGEITEARLPRVLAGLGIKERDYKILVASELSNDDTDFSFPNFTALYRCVLFARALRVSIEEFVRLAGTANGLTGLDPFANPAAALAFADQVAAIKESEFSVNELDWLLRHQWTGTDPLDEAAVGRSLGALARAMNTIEAEVALLADPNGEGLTINLLEVIEVADVAEALKIVALTSTLSSEDQDTFIEEKFVGFLDVEVAKDVLVDDTSVVYLADVALRRAWLLGKVVGHLRRRALVLDTVAGEFGLAVTVAEVLLDDVLTAGGNPLMELYRLPFATEAQVTVGLTSATHANEFAGWLRLAKAALVCERFDLRADETVWYPGRGAWLDLDALPLTAIAADATFESWERLRRALQLRKLYRKGELAAAEIAAATTLEEAIGILADHAGWDAAGVLAVAEALGYDDDDTAAMAEETIPERLRVIVAAGDRMGVALDVLFSWATTAPTMTQTAAIKAATRAKYGEDRWPEVAKPLRDVIRERQRDALVDAAISITPAFRTSTDVFKHLLIDVEMSACMLTSRIKQAIAAVQIFIHRVLLHLEVDEIAFDPEAIDRWDWTKNYRVWEANRKVFLYPENWIEPELRLDKTPEFLDLEAILMQGVLDQHRVEKALNGYLEKLARFANLEMISTFEHPETKELWVLGRTQATPHEWFIRRRLASGSWQAWEAVPHAIESNAAVLFVNRGRLHLFWANRYEVVIKGEEEGKDHIAYNFRLSHLERSADGWGKPTISAASTTSFLPRHEYRIQFADTDAANTYVWVLWHSMNWVGGQVGVAAAFRYSRIEQRAQSRSLPTASGYHVEEVNLGSVTAEVVLLNDRIAIGLQPLYAFEGQRNTRHNMWTGDGFTGDDADFRQGTAQVPLFSHPSSGGTTTFVHQADLLYRPTPPSLLPAIYDDRIRKYVIDPNVSYFFVDANPAHVGHFDPMTYAACPELATFVPETVIRPGTGVRKIQDDVSVRQPWGGTGAPGHKAALSNLVLLDNPDLDYNYSTLMVKVNEAVEASLELGDNQEGYPIDPQGFVLDMQALYHPYVRLMQEALASDGWLGLYAPPVSSGLFRQQVTDDPFGVEQMDLNTPAIRGKIPIEEFDFSFDAPYAVYNWELFYHVPMLIAGKLATEQRWDEAQRWYHLMFNPVDIVKLGGETATSKFWRIKPFFQEAGTLAKDQFEIMLGIGATAQEQQAAIQAFSKQVAMWEANPFDPHAVARVRPGVYQRALLREYFDNLIAWADNLFRRDTIESITEATVLYIVVGELLGRRPQEVPGSELVAQTFAELDASGLDAFSNAMVKLESWIHLPAQAVKKQGCGEGAPPDAWVRVPVVSHFWYFCYPPNPELLKYWDILQDRLFKIRHCQNIEGVERQLPLFEPPIDPALLVQATAAGVDIQSVLAELDSGLPPYRFRSVHARASGFTNSLRSLGGALLSALEKQDSEELARLRSEHELELLGRVRDIRIKQRDESQAALNSLEAALEGSRQRQTHYFGLLVTGLSAEEKQQGDSAKEAQHKRSRAEGLQSTATILSGLPQISVFPPDSEVGGVQLSNVFGAMAAGYSFLAMEHDWKASQAGTKAVNLRRAEDWSLQFKQAELEGDRIEKDIIGAKIRLAIAEREVENHDLQMDHARSLDQYMRTKFTNRELYDWMLGQLATLYFQTYQLAFDLAKRAERAYRHELAIPTTDAPIIKYGYWDSLRKGLLAGEKLGHALERLDLAYMDRDIREFELRKSISLAELNPDELNTLRETGECTFDVFEALFDLDHPGHYLRRIRAVRITIPAVVGQHTSLGARLKLESHKTRVDKATGGYAEEENDERFRYGTGGGQAIATSTAMSDGGLFNLDFKDERYLPFEYCGAISTWNLKLPDTVRQFDYRSIEDVVIHIDYTAREGGDGLRTEAEGNLAERLNSMLEGEELALLVSVHEALPNEWEQFFTLAASDHVLSLPIEADQFPYFARRSGFGITKVDVVILVAPDLAAADLDDMTAELDIDETAIDFLHTGGEAFVIATFTPTTPPIDPDTWTLTIPVAEIPEALQNVANALDPTKAVGMVLIIRYTLTT